MKASKMVTEEGQLEKLLPKFRYVHTAKSFIQEKVRNPELRKEKIPFLNVENHALYTVEDGNSILYLDTFGINPIFHNLSVALAQLNETGNYRRQRTEGEKILDSVLSPSERHGENEVKIYLECLRLKGQNAECKYFDVPTSDYEKQLVTQEKKLAEAIFGNMEKNKNVNPDISDFDKAMNMLRDEGIKAARIHVLSPEYVQVLAPSEKTFVNGIYVQGPIGRMCLLDMTDAYEKSCSFSAAIREISTTAIIRGLPYEDAK